jgi:hypothetical protein
VAASHPARTGLPGLVDVLGAGKGA